MQHELFRLSNVRSAARVAASNTSSTPSPVKDEHSRYRLAPTCVAVSVPSLVVTNRSDFFLISSIARGSSRRSFFNPTNIMGTPGHRSWASSIHCDCILADSYNQERRGTNLVFHILQRIWRVHSKPNQDDMSFRVRQWPQPLVVFLTSSIP